MSVKFLDLNDNNETLEEKLLKQVLFFKNNNLVYVYVPKNASSYYSGLFEDNNWQKVRYREIDWQNDYVFGFLRDPVERYFKGLVEECWANNIVSVEQFIEDNRINIETENHFLLFTHHGLPVSMMLREYANKINWVPLTIDNNAYVNDLCQKHNIVLDYSDHLNSFEANDEKNKMYNYFRSTFKENNLLLMHLLKDDIELYNRVVGQYA